MPVSPGSHLNFLLLIATSMDVLGLALAADGGYSTSELSDAMADFDLEFTHAGYVNMQPDSLAASSGLDVVAGDAGGSSPWYGYWQIFKDPTVNPHVGADMDGAYGGQAIWQITFGL